MREERFSVEQIIDQLRPAEDIVSQGLGCCIDLLAPWDIGAEVR